MPPTSACTAPSGRIETISALLHAEFLALFAQFCDQRRLCGLLHAQIDAGVNDDILMHRTHEIIEHVHNVIGGIIGGSGSERTAQLCRSRHGIGHACLVDIALIGHGGEDEGGAVARGRGVARRSEPRRRLHQTGQHGRFRQRQFTRALVEIASRRSLDTIGARTEIDAVHIELEQFVLAVVSLQPEGEDRLLDLARGGTLLGEEQVSWPVAG